MPAFHKQWNLLPTGSFTLFLLGLIAYRLGLFDQPERHRRMIIAIMTAGAVSWALAIGRLSVFAWTGRMALTH